MLLTKSKKLVKMTDQEENKLKVIDILKQQVSLSFEEVEDIICFIHQSLDNEYDQYTCQYACDESWEDGMRSMNPKMFGLMESLQKRLYERKG